MLCLALIWILSLTPFFPETPLDDVEFIDKWTHLVMYGGTSAVIWWEYLRSHHAIHWHRLLWIAVAGMMVLGGVIELLQAYCTTTRSGEWLDFVADTLGVLIGCGLGLLLYFCWWRRVHR
ncbi:MAG: VanZ family protein [Prevotella sp.]|nr:VanZ family protein [Prevotella sp.]